MAVTHASLLAGIAGALTAGAGLVHASAAGTHAGDTRLAVLFAVTAVAQVLLGAVVAVRPGRVTLAAATLVNLGIAAAWGVSRLSDPVGVQDLTATVMEVVAAGVGLLTLVQRGTFSTHRLSPVCAVALLPALVGMTAAHSHSGDGHHDTASHQLAADPIFSGVDTSHASEDELDAAKALIVTTRDSVLRTLPDEAAVLRAGYVSIGDGRLSAPYEHFIHPGYLTDGKELDPSRIESIVLEDTGSGKRVASAMYILELGKTMSDVAETGGDLMVWHDHQNLCWDSSGIRLAGLLVNGRCLPGGTFRPTPPMLHVWLQDHQCGPFAGIEGHGAVCTRHHAN